MMVKLTTPRPDAPGHVPADSLYTLAEIQERLKLGQHAMRQARRASRKSRRKPRAAAIPLSRCIDLGKRFGRRYRVEYEPSYLAQYGPDARINDPWLKIIPCRAGHICPWGGSILAAVTDKGGRVARKLANLPGVIVWQEGDDGVTVLFDVADFSRVARILHPRRRCVLVQRRLEFQ